MPDIEDGQMLAQRFRPYYKFSVDHGREPCRPCSWQWFAAHGELYRKGKLLATGPDFIADPAKLLSFPDADIRNTGEPVGLLMFRATGQARAGEPWPAVINEGAGLYAQCEDAGDGFVVLTYWTLFGYNQTTVNLPGITSPHEGDITAVTIVYDRKRDLIVRASYGIHGHVIASFDLVPPKSVDVVQLKGRDAANNLIAISACRVHTPRDYQDGPSWHSPSAAEIYLVQDPESERFEHLAVFCEWGSHQGPRIKSHLNYW